jgi:predicted ATPase/serine/threonine protein kinase/Tfp pilus assembly protein PilF
MTPGRWARMEAVFLRALDCAPAERAAFLDRECDDDTTLRREVEAMLATNERLGSFLENPAAAQTSIGRSQAATALVGSRMLAKRCEGCGGRFDESHRFCPDDGSPLVEDPEALVGATLDGLYRIDALLGIGGMGAVYRAVHVLLRDVVAIKVLPRSVSENPRWLHRFMREGHAARRFRHPSAVTVYDLRMTEDGIVFLVLEYVEGETLRAALGRGRLGAAEALEVLESVAGCLDAAHRAGVIHRDVKPENIMIGTGGGPSRVKLLDLGIAKLLSDDRPGASANLTVEGTALGTPRYMPPEQWGEPQRDGIDDVDGRADVYSLGVVAYEMVVGEPPFAGKSWSEIRRQHTKESARPAHERTPEVSETFGLAIAQAMAKDRAERFATPGEFVRALRQTPATPLREEIETVKPSQETEVNPAHTVEKFPTNLPAPLTSFVGRAREVADVVRLLESSRLVTIAGPGGIGKTRLALRVASEALGRFPDGVWFADLAPLSDPTLVALAVATAVGVQDRSSASYIDLLCQHARARRLMIVLDNCEHLLAECSSLAARVLRSCPNVSVLATSRQELGIREEIVWQTPPLEAHEAERLFVDRAYMARREFVVSPGNAASIEELCRQLEGLPLAVELAAARVRVLTPTQMLGRLGQRLNLLAPRQPDLTDRHRTLRATIDWSYGLLAEQEQRVFAGLSVFRGGWTLDAAETVVGDDECRMMSSEVVDVLERLTATSLVIGEECGDEMRYRMLESIREFGLERVAASGEIDELRRRHAAYFLALAEAADPDLPGRHREEWYARLEVDHDNIRAALQWSLDHDPDACLRAATGVREFWTIHGHMTEARRWLTAALERSPDAPLRTQWVALHGIAHVARNQGDPVTARRYFEASARVAKEMGDARLFALSNHGLGLAAEMEGDLEAAQTYWKACLVAVRRENFDKMVANTLNALGELARQQGDFVQAREYYEQALEPARRAEFHDCVSAVLGNLGTIAFENGDLRAASGYYRDSLTSAQQIGSKDGIAFALDGLAMVAARQSTWERAGRLAGAAEALRGQIGHEPDPADRAMRARYLAEVREALGDAGLESTAAVGREMTLEQVTSYALEE